MKIEAVLRWLEAHPTWLMILDNVDTPEAVAAVGRLMARLRGGRVIVTARASNFPASLRKLELDVLDEDAAAAFLLERTRDDRTLADDDADKARAIARELGGLALGLEQAGAFIATERIGFADYLRLWSESRQRLVDWFDRTQAEYDHDTGLAATWATSVDRPVARKPRPARPPRDAGAGSDSRFADRRRLSRPGGGRRCAKRARRALRLFARHPRARRGRLGEGFRHAPPGAGFRPAGDDGRAVGRSAAGSVGLDRRRVRRRPSRTCGAGRSSIRSPRMRSRSRGGRTRQGSRGRPGGCSPSRVAASRKGAVRRGRVAASPRARDRGNDATGRITQSWRFALNNLASLLQTTNRLGDAEPLYRRAMAIDEESLGPDNPEVASNLNNLATLLRGHRAPWGGGAACIAAHGNFRTSSEQIIREWRRA